MFHIFFFPLNLTFCPSLKFTNITEYNNNHLLCCYCYSYSNTGALMHSTISNPLTFIQNVKPQTAVVALNIPVSSSVFDPVALLVLLTVAFTIMLSPSLINIIISCCEKNSNSSHNLNSLLILYTLHYILVCNMIKKTKPR